MFQKSIIGIALILSSASVMAAPELPFIGKRTFNFMGGSGTAQLVQISKTGSTVIKSCGKFSCSTDYKGHYKASIPTSDGYYKFTATKVYWFKRNGEMMRGCSGEEREPCIADLYKN